MSKSKKFIEKFKKQENWHDCNIKIKTLTIQARLRSENMEVFFFAPQWASLVKLSLAQLFEVWTLNLTAHKTILIFKQGVM